MGKIPSGKTHILKDGKRIRAGTTPGGREYHSSRDGKGKQKLTMVVDSDGRDFHKGTDRSTASPKFNFKEKKLYGDKYIDTKKGPTTPVKKAPKPRKNKV